MRLSVFAPVAGLAMVLLFAAGCGRAQAPRTGANAGLEVRQVTVGGERRRFDLFVPADRSGPLPLVIVFHGGGGNPGRIARQTGFSGAAAQHGFVVAYPASIEHWNDGRATTRGFGDDVALTRQIIDTLARDELIDRRRVYATGASNGGMMTLRLACEAGDVIAAFASVMASFPVPFADRCQPAGSVHLLMINGTRDRLIKWQGGPIPKGRRVGVGGEVIPVPDTVRFWREHNVCAAPEVSALPDQDAADGTRVYRESGTCDGGSFTLLRVEGGGHTWPSTPVQPNVIAGRVSRDIDATEVIWQYFADKSLPSVGARQ